MKKNAKMILEICEIANNSDSNFIESCLYYAEKNNIEIETLGEMIKRFLPSIKSNIRIEAEDLNLLEKTSRLPI